ncbi:hypothetical protein SMGD1_0431 [Sulfurimonas gotlandica GD1]|uniref:Uncharacterized protein n=2 Tax=Sulfurimonas TaxID=202746 RepID=B6BKA5_SULGG|nr:hypothetical protein CBGD1_224 [Sulfurimonas gotlandica GD1]EHP28958.1 hypothetical protein SMGD1_0431 [Sulfurimonas gotlandica GD1]
MDSEIIYSAVGIVIFIIIVIMTMRSNVVEIVQSKEEKRADIVNGYKKELQDALEPLKNDTDSRLAKKSEMLQRFNGELSLNIFFDKDELREIILELSQE